MGTQTGTPQGTQTDLGEAGAAAPTGTSATSETSYEIGGKTYTPAEFEQLKADLIVEARQKAQQDATAKWEEAARMRREAEEIAAQNEAYAAELAAREAAYQPSYTSEDDPNAKRFGALEAGLKRIEQTLAQNVAQQEAAAQEDEAATKLATAVQSLSNRPFYNPNEIVDFMVDRGLGPEHAEIAYTALYGPRLYQAIGEAEAIKRGAAVRPIMGQTGVTPPFNSAEEAPGAVKPDADWDDLANAAMTDGRRRGVKFGG